MSGSAERLPRLLALVPYLLARPGIRIEEAAQDFDVSAKQLRKDLELLWMCGLPGYGPGDLIDLSFDGDTVSVTFDAGMRRPLRLTGGEASALVIALKALAETPGVVDTEAVHRAIAKIEAAAGDAQPSGVVVGHGVREAQHTARTRETMREALQAGRALRMRYYTASKDEITERTVDPMRLLIVQGVGYLEAWCRRANAVRLFRLDRVDELAVLPEPAEPPGSAEPTDLTNGVFSPRPDYPEAELVLAPDARWVAEYYPCEELAELEGGRLRVRMRYGDESWLVRLVLRLGGQLTVEKPPALAQAVRKRAADALARARHLPVTLNQ
ncbi:putative transcriptional regulator [Saccharomonospora marina XMU15]|uniref:Putative transcriptional regulator n=1 Tax=Saccharomonospora marina XMU15 TaxID=882083 RepID=H5X3R6_9PSEU|nr:YafY family protein [Saccharomonospora marina]EHR51079.1 putative transcriptional regulator [Saccharomonospora marina XMU15]